MISLLLSPFMSMRLAFVLLNALPCLYKAFCNTRNACVMALQFIPYSLVVVIIVNVESFEFEVRGLSFVLSQVLSYVCHGMFSSVVKRLLQVKL